MRRNTGQRVAKARPLKNRNQTGEHSQSQVLNLGSKLNKNTIYRGFEPVSFRCRLYFAILRVKNSLKKVNSAKVEHFTRVKNFGIMNNKESHSKKGKNG